MTKEELFEQTYGYPFELSAVGGSDPAPAGGPLYYYTTVETFQKIVETGSIFASHIKRMNDWKEFDVGAAKVLSEMKESIKERRKEIYKQTKRIAPGEDVAGSDANSIKKKKREQADGLLNYYRVPFLEEATRSLGRCCRYLEGGELQMYRFSEGGVYGMDYAFPELYSISFTNQPDLLSQWKMYARESGVAIELDFAGKGGRLIFLQEVLNDGKDDKDFLSPCTYPREISYEINVGSLSLKDALELKKNFSSVPYYKDTGFRQESEARLIFRPYKKLNGDKLIYSKLGYRTANYLIIPYLKIYCAEAGNPDQLGWPIVSLTVGPGHNQDAVFEGLIHFVEYGPLKICKFTDEELMWARIRYYYEFLADCGILHMAEPPSASGRTTWEENAGAEIKRKGITSAIEQERFLYARGQKSLKRDQYDQRFREFCGHAYLATNGVIVRKSRIPYIFS